MNTASALSLARDSFGRLSLTDAQGVTHEGVVAVRAHPISAPEEGIALVSQDGHEVAWIDQLASLPAAQRALIEAALAEREFMPEITRLKGVSSFATPSTWSVETNRGSASFVLKGEEDIRRLPGGILLISDAHGIQFMIRSLAALDRHSRKLLDRFL
ncbi:MAG: hypothetical protein H6R19_2753 [Proteobacteria bacterium]|nr:hypothetical protein [Pseudomonadota bacterium]